MKYVLIFTLLTVTQFCNIVSEAFQAVEAKLWQREVKFYPELRAESHLDRFPSR